MKKDKLLLVTLNGRYHHSSLSLRYLLANFKLPNWDATILEFTINENGRAIVEKILAECPQVIAFSIYIWNVEQSLAVIQLLKAIVPEVKIILGGPEISFDSEKHPLFPHADFIIQGEGEEALPLLLQNLNNSPKVVSAPILDLSKIELPYELYSAEDLKNRFIYVETTRGCPYRCSFCLSSLDNKVRFFPLEKVLHELKKLMDRGARTFKFVDRTFNVRSDWSIEILKFFLPYSDTFLHFEIVPEILDDDFIELAARFEKGRLQFEMGIQTFTPAVARRVDRYLDEAKLRKNIQKVLAQTQVHLHTDLIIGLPGETREEIAKGFNTLIHLKPHEIQVGILKLLPGAPLAKLSEEYQMKYSKQSPYEIIQNSTLSFAELQKFQRFARYMDLIINRGNFPSIKDLLFSNENPFEWLWKFSEFAYQEHEQTFAISLDKLAHLLFCFLGESEEARSLLTQDLLQIPGRTLPRFLRTDLSEQQKKEKSSLHNKRQSKA